MTHQIDDWTNCYDLGWKGLLYEDKGSGESAFSHPAKFSHGLITRIVKHAIDEGFIQPDQIVLDPFGGVACGALACMQYGLHWVGVELEQKFVALGQANIALWNERFGPHFPNWGSAVLLQGDSRRLAEIVAGAGLVVGSPPFTSIEPSNANREWHQKRNSIGKNNSLGTGHYGQTPGQLATLPPGSIEAVIASPPFAGNTGGRGEASRNGIDAALFDRHSGGMKKGTGDDPGNLDHLPVGNIQAVISSPPYAESLEKKGGIDPNKSNYIGGPHSQMNRSDTRYGQTPGQLGAMKTGELAVVGSPPYADGGIAHNNRDYAPGKIEQAQTIGATAKRATWGYNKGSNGQDDYGQTPGQLGTDSGETFWSAARLIVEQCALLLPPGAAAIWVVKRYVKSGKIIDFPGQWRQLCEACGFETIHEHRAWLVKNQGLRQSTIEGEAINKETRRASFFRLLAEKNGAPKIDWETVLCMVRR